MKTLIPLLLAFLSLSSFAKGGSDLPTGKCQGTEKLVTKAVAEDLNDFIEHSIRYGYGGGWNEPMKKSEVSFQQVLESDTMIHIYHTTTNPDYPEFLTALPKLNLKFLKEIKTKTGILCKWQQFTIGYKILDVRANQEVDKMIFGASVVKIPAIK